MTMLCNIFTCYNKRLVHALSVSTTYGVQCDSIIFNDILHRVLHKLVILVINILYNMPNDLSLVGYMSCFNPVHPLLQSCF